MELGRRSFIWYSMVAIPAALVLLFVTSIIEIGWHEFVDHLLHPEVDPEPYDLLAASLVGGIAVILGITTAAFAAGASLSSVRAPKGPAVDRLANSWLWIFPATLLGYTLATLASTAYGFPRYATAVVVQGLLGVGAWAAFVRLIGKATAMMFEATPEPAPPEPPPSHTDEDVGEDDPEPEGPPRPPGTAAPT